MSTSYLPSFIKIHQAVLEKKSKMWKFTDGRTDAGRRTDGRTDDGRCAMTIAHLSLWLRWAKKLWPMLKFLKSRSKFTVRSHVQNLWYHQKGLVMRNTRAKYESPISYGKKVRHNVKVCWRTVITSGHPLLLGNFCSTFDQSYRSGA